MAVDAARLLCNAHQTVVRPAHAVQGSGVARHDIKHVGPRQRVCGFVEDLRRQLFVLWEVNSWFVSGGTRRGRSGRRVAVEGAFLGEVPFVSAHGSATSRR